MRQVHESSGTLCFETTPDGATIVEHRLDGCLDSGSTDGPEKSVIATVTQVPPVVRVQVSVVTAPSGAITCITDCNLVPGMNFDPGVVPTETYQVYLGDSPVGTWAPVPGAEPVRQAG